MSFSINCPMIVLRRLYLPPTPAPTKNSWKLLRRCAYYPIFCFTRNSERGILIAWLKSYHEIFLVPLAIRLFRELPNDYDAVVRPSDKLLQREEAKDTIRETQGRRHLNLGKTGSLGGGSFMTRETVIYGTLIFFGLMAGIAGTAVLSTWRGRILLWLAMLIAGLVFYLSVRR